MNKANGICRKYSAVICILFLNACAVNGVGVGFTVTTTTTQMGSIEHINGYGLLFDTRSPTRSISIGEINRFLICPVSQINDANVSLMALFEETQSDEVIEQSFHPDLCQQGSIVARERNGLSLDFSLTHMRLLMGHQRQTIVHINKDLDSLFHVQYNSGKPARGKAVLLIPKEAKQ